MFKKIRRFKQQLSQDECIKILNTKTCGTLALLGNDGYPYAVPLSYVYDDGKIYFHSAKSGHKIEAINDYKKASFCIIAKNEIKDMEYTTYFQSVILFGKVKIITDTPTAKARWVLMYVHF